MSCCAPIQEPQSGAEFSGEFFFPVYFYRDQQKNFATMNHKDLICLSPSWARSEHLCCEFRDSHIVSMASHSPECIATRFFFFPSRREKNCGAAGSQWYMKVAAVADSAGLLLPHCLFQSPQFRLPVQGTTFCSVIGGWIWATVAEIKKCCSTIFRVHFADKPLAGSISKKL